MSTHLIRQPALCLVLASTGMVAAEIHQAAKAGDLAKVRDLLLKDPKGLSAKDPEGRSPLHGAAQGGQVGVMAFLLEQGADINAQDTQSATALHQAAAANQGESVTLLIGKGARIDVPDYKLRTPLHYAAVQGAKESLAALLKGKPSLEHKDAYGRTPLVLGVRERGGPEVVRMLLVAGADVSSRDKYGSDALGLAAWRGSISMVDALLDHKAPVPSPGPAAMRLLSSSAAGGLARLFRLLATPGLDLTRKNGLGGSLLHDAARGGSADIVTELIDRGLDVQAKDACGWTPTHYAALEGRIEALKLLLQKGADPNARNLSGQTPLNIAEASGHTALKQALLGAKADPCSVRFPVLMGDYLGQPPPGKTPKLFAQGIVSSIWGLHSSVAFSPDGNEAYWRAMNDKSGAMLFMQRVNGQWTAPGPASFSGSSIDDVPFFAADGSRLYFLSERPIPGHSKSGRENIWFVDRKGSGWSEPRPLDPVVNAMEMHWQFSVDLTGNIYFNSQAPGGKGGSDIWMARWENGQYRAPENLGTPINSSKAEGDPFIAPDGSYLLFNREMDLVISYRQQDGAWTEPIALDAPINTRADERCPLVTPDGKYLFFNSTRAGESGAYWVEAGFIEELRKTAHLPAAVAILQAAVEKDGLAAAQAKSKDILTHMDQYRFKEADLIALGYRYLQAKQVGEAIVVFESAAGAFPGSWNAWDSLGEAYLKVGDRLKADASYARSLALNPQNVGAMELLSETKESLRHQPGAPTGLKGEYFAQTPPGLTPTVFAPGIVSTYGHFDTGIVFSPDGRECYFGRRKDGNLNALMVSRREAVGWTMPEEASFAKGFPSQAPCITPDGRKLYFGTRRPHAGSPQPDYENWVVERTPEGAWGEPRYHDSGMKVSAASSGNLYMTDTAGVAGGGGIVYPCIDGKLGAPRNLGSTFNGPVPVDHLFIAPDESYIIFDAEGRPGGQGGEGDLWISFRRPDGTWSDPQNLGDAINTPGLNFCPSVSPDGKYLFYTMNRDIYWVSTKALEPLRANALSTPKE